MCVICEHQAHHHSESGCQLTTCSCIKFEEKKSIKRETKQGQKSSTQNRNSEKDWTIKKDIYWKLNKNKDFIRTILNIIVL